MDIPDLRALTGVLILREQCMNLPLNSMISYQVKSMSIGCLDVETVTYFALDYSICGRLTKLVIMSERVMVEGDIRAYVEMLKKHR